MRLAVTGASGFIGRQIVPFLQEAGVDLVLLGRDRQALRNTFGASHTVAGYDELENTIAGVNAVLHLAIMNNSQSGCLSEFRKANVEFLKKVVMAAQDSGVNHLIYTTTFQVTKNIQTPYAVSKREAEQYLSTLDETLTVTQLTLPAVYGNGVFAGKLAILNTLPNILRRQAFYALAALKPTVHGHLVANAVIDSLKHPKNTQVNVSDRQIGNWVYGAVKRLVDLVFAFAVLGLFSWLLIIVWLVIKATSTGPGLFAQSRVGKNERIFTCYKFRTMKVGTKIAGTHEVSEARVTRIGAIIRRLKIDELPQAWNIICNQMSLVGPRPCLPVQFELIEARRRRGVFDAKCGLTGLAQINDIDMSIPERLAKIDASYLAIRTLPLDIKIILRTFLGAGRADRVSSSFGAPD
jgi:lipopolysaccharide/colanic/teichoic acid biosynthesis glycosyltransferase